MDIDQMATELAASIQRAHEDEPVYGSDIVALVRAVVQDEIRQAGERAQVEQQLETQAMWDSDEFKAQVAALREGRPVVTPSNPTRCQHCGYNTVLHDVCRWCGKAAQRRDCCKPDGAHHVCHLHTGRCCYSNG